MKTLKLIYSNAVKILFLSVIISFSSCSKDDDGDDNGEDNLVIELPATRITTYTGVLNYTNGGTVITNLEGTATLTETSNDTYSISFSDNVPSITGIQFIENSDGDYISASAGSTNEGVVVGNDGSLVVGQTSNGANWAFSSN